MLTLRKGGFKLVEIMFMVILLTFISPFLFDFGSDSLNELFREVYDHADSDAKDDFLIFVDTELCLETGDDVEKDFSSELSHFCKSDQQGVICDSDNAIYDYQSEICVIYDGGNLAEFCGSLEDSVEVADIKDACELLDNETIGPGDFFMLYSQGELELVEDDVFDHGSVHDTALDALNVPRVVRFENYLVWQRLVFVAILLVLLYVLAGDIRTMTHKIGHVFVQTGGFLVIYRFVITLFILIFGIDTSYLFEFMITSNGSVPFSEVFSEVFFSLFLLMHKIFYEPTYWVVSISFICIGLILYIPWFMQKRKLKRTKKTLN